MYGAKPADIVEIVKDVTIDGIFPSHSHLYDDLFVADGKNFVSSWCIAGILHDSKFREFSYQMLIDCKKGLKPMLDKLVEDGALIHRVNPDPSKSDCIGYALGPSTRTPDMEEHLFYPEPESYEQPEPPRWTSSRMSKSITSKEPFTKKALIKIMRKIRRRSVDYNGTVLEELWHELPMDASFGEIKTFLDELETEGIVESKTREGYHPDDIFYSLTEKPESITWIERFVIDKFNRFKNPDPVELLGILIIIMMILVIISTLSQCFMEVS